MSNKKDGVGFWKPLGVGLLAGASSLTGHSGEPIEQKPGLLPALIAQPVHDILAALPTHGQEPVTDYRHTFQGVVARETTSSGMGSWLDDGNRQFRAHYNVHASTWIAPVIP